MKNHVCRHWYVYPSVMFPASRRFMKLRILLDKFAAFAGIAQHICQEFNDEYAAGIFKKLLPRALLWYSSEEFPPHHPSTGYQRPDYSTANSYYRAPSWSRAKMDSPVRFLGHHRRVEVVTSVLWKYRRSRPDQWNRRHRLAV